MRHGLNLKQIREITKRHYLAMFHIVGTPEADMIDLVNEIMRLRGILLRSNKKQEMLNGRRTRQKNGAYRKDLDNQSHKAKEEGE